MTNPNLERIQITPEIVERFAQYRWNEPLWGHLHVVLDDGNLEDNSVEFCWGTALAAGDLEAMILARILLTMTRTQRSKITRKAEDWLNIHWRLMLCMVRMTGAHEMYKANLRAGTYNEFRVC